MFFFFQILCGSFFITIIFLFILGVSKEDKISSPANFIPEQGIFIVFLKSN